MAILHITQFLYISLHIFFLFFLSLFFFSLFDDPLFNCVCYKMFWSLFNLLFEMILITIIV